MLTAVVVVCPGVLTADTTGVPRTTTGAAATGAVVATLATPPALVLVAVDELLLVLVVGVPFAVVVEPSL